MLSSDQKSILHRHGVLAGEFDKYHSSIYSTVGLSRWHDASDLAVDTNFCCHIARDQRVVTDDREGVGSAMGALSFARRHISA